MPEQGSRGWRCRYALVGRCSRVDITALGLEQTQGAVGRQTGIAGPWSGSGLRCTPQRYAVMAFLMEHSRHPTAAEIFEAVNRVDPRSSRPRLIIILGLGAGEFGA